MVKLQLFCKSLSYYDATENVVKLAALLLFVSYSPLPSIRKFWFDLTAKSVFFANIELKQFLGLDPAGRD